MTNQLITGVIPEFGLGDRLRKAREVKGWEQQQLAEQLGIHRQTLAKYERGEGTPRRSVLMAWALMTGVDVFWLRGDDNPTRESSDEPWFYPAEDRYLDALGGTVRPEGFEPPAYCSVADDYAKWSMPCADGHHNGCRRSLCGCPCHDSQIDEVDVRDLVLAA